MAITGRGFPNRTTSYPRPIDKQVFASQPILPTYSRPILQAIQRSSSR